VVRPREADQRGVDLGEDGNRGVAQDEG